MQVKQIIKASLLFLNWFLPLFGTDFVIVTPTYNNEQWCIKNVQAVVDQTCQNWHMVIVNDCSTDRTSHLLHDYIAVHDLGHKITLIDNTERRGALRNLYETIHACPDNTVVITYDGDDWFANNHALQRIAQEYENPAVWLTYGQYQGTNGVMGMCRDFPTKVLKKRSFRKYQWLSSHPRTFYAWLFKKINKDDLMFEGKFFPVAWDLAIMFPMLEMASNGHIRCISDVLYIYNVQNPLNDFKQHAMLQEKLDAFVRKKRRYKAL